MTTCKIIIQDETTCKLTNLDLSTRKKLVNKFKYEIPGARYTPAVKLGRWDGKKAFAQLGGSTYINLLPEILPILDEEGYDIELEDLRDYNTIFEFEAVTPTSYSHIVWPKGHKHEGEPIMLREDQVEAINLFLNNTQGIQCLATGFGKCLVGKTELHLQIDLNTPFGKFMINKLHQEMEINLSIGKLAKYIEEFKEEQLEDHRELNIEDLGISVPTPAGWQKIEHFIMKKGLSTKEITLDNNHSFEAANKHIVISNNRDTFVDTLSNGDTIHVVDGVASVVDITDTGINDCFDIGIQWPHVYYDASGILHHNTILTGVLSHRCEPYGRTIVIVPSKDLVKQTEEDYINMKLDVGVFYGDRKEYTKTHTICTWQSLNSLFKNTKNGEAQIPFNEFIEGVVCIMVDECLAPGTMVMTPTGEALIESLSTGDKVISFNEESKSFVVDEVVKLHTNLSKSESVEMYEFEMEDGSKIQITGNHEVLTDRGWVEARDLNEGDNIVSYCEPLQMKKMK